jgi:hypothetical protein
LPIGERRLRIRMHAQVSRVAHQEQGSQVAQRERLSRRAGGKKGRV